MSLNLGDKNPPAHVCINPRCKGKPDTKGMALGGTAWLCCMECRHEVARDIYDHLTQGLPPADPQERQYWYIINRGDSTV